MTHDTEICLRSHASVKNFIKEFTYNNNLFIYKIFVSCDTLRTLFTKFLTPGFTHKLCNPQYDWLDGLIPTNHRKVYIIRRLARELKV